MLGAANGREWIGPAAVVGFLVLHLVVADAPLVQARLVGATLLVGLVSDGTLLALGIVHYSGKAPAGWCPPPWVLALWALFGTTLDSSLAWLQGRPWLAALLGLVGGPMAYAAGARLGAARALDPGALVAVAMAWGLLTPLLSTLASRLRRRSG